LDPSTRQKTHTSGSVAGARIRQAFRGFTAEGREALHVTWDDEHQSAYTRKQLRDMLSWPRDERSVGATHPRLIWDRRQLLQSQLRRPYSDASTDRGMLGILAQVQQYGVVILEGVPHDLVGDKDCELRAFAESIGPIRNTFYGETWDVKNVKNSKNVAYTNVNLGLHMDLL
jgi:hypothetical protein